MKAAACAGGGAADAVQQRQLTDVGKEMPELVECSMGQGHTLLLKLCFFLDDNYCPFVTLALQSKHVDATERLAGRLRDAEEEIVQLKGAVAAAAAAQAAAKSACIPALSLRTTVAVGSNTLLTWNTPVPGVVCADVFALDAGNQTVRVKVRGVYQLHVTVTNKNSGNGQYLCLLVNGAERCRCYEAEASGTHFQQATLFDVLDLNANDAITVRPFASGNTHADALGNRFNIVLLQRL